MRFARIMMVLLLGVGLLCQCGKKKEDRAKDRYFEGVELVRQKKMQEAIEVFKDVQDRYPATEWAVKAKKDLVFYEDAAQIDQYSKQLTVKADLREIARACEMYRGHANVYPDSISQLMPTYVKRVIKDPWGRAYLYLSEKRGRTSYSLACFGADQIPGGEGDDMDIFIEDGRYTAGSQIGDIESGKDSGNS